MKFENIAIAVMMLYIMISPALIIMAEDRGEQKGFTKGYFFHDALDKELAEINAQINATEVNSDSYIVDSYQPGDYVKSSLLYERTFNKTFTGTITEILPFDEGSSGGVYHINSTEGQLIISEFWIEPINSRRVP